MDLIEIYDDGTKGANEVARWQHPVGHEFVLKVLVISRPKVHQRRKALTESVFWELDAGLGGQFVSNPIEVGMWNDSLFPWHQVIFGEDNAEGWQRMCWVKRGFSPGVPGDVWRGSLFQSHGNLNTADIVAKGVIDSHPDSARIALLDFLTGNQDRSARNWVTTMGKRFFAIDNGMAWFHEYWSKGEQNNYPEYGWRQGFVIDDVLIQRPPWRFISGVFTTSWAGRPIPKPLLAAARAFDKVDWLRRVANSCEALGYPTGVAGDWRFEAIMRRMDYMASRGKFPNAGEYRRWRENGSSLLTPPEIIASGGQEVWNIAMDYDYLNEAAYKKLSGGPERPPHDSDDSSDAG